MGTHSYRLMLITIHSDSDNDSDAHYDTQKLNSTVNMWAYHLVFVASSLKKIIILPGT